MNTPTKLTVIAAWSLCGIGWISEAKAAPSEGSLTFGLDNDVFTGSDNNYTNGLGITWASADVKSYDESRFVSKWARLWSFLPFVSDEDYTTYAAWTLAQEMHTPDDIENPNPPENVQPYAGVLYVDSLLYARNEHWTTSINVRPISAQSDVLLLLRTVRR